MDMLTVRQYQMDLKHYYGYYSGAADGINGAGTTAAVRAFQRGHSIFADGIYGPKTDSRLVSAVMSLQSKVGVKQDGVIGPNTVAAIKRIQQKYGLTADGIAGTKTFEKLNATSSGSSGASSGSTSSGSWKGSAHFTKQEFVCRCGGKYCSGYPADVSSRLVSILESLRSYYGKPITITSGLRCTRHNALVGGVSNSAHKYGKAADIFIPGICSTAAGRRQVVAKAYALGAAYSYANTKGMGNVVHINV